MIGVVKMNKRAECLDKAKEYVCTDRPNQYGSPEDNFKKIADYWSLYKGVEFSAHDVAMMMALLKVARIQTGTQKADSYIDLLGYGSCAYELAQILDKRLDLMRECEQDGN